MNFLRYKKNVIIFGIIGSLVTLFYSCNPILFDSAPPKKSISEFIELEDLEGIYLEPYPGLDDSLFTQFKDEFLSKVDSSSDNFIDFSFKNYTKPKLLNNNSDTLNYILKALSGNKLNELYFNDGSIKINSYFYINKQIFEKFTSKSKIKIKEDSTLSVFSSIGKNDTIVIDYIKIKGIDTLEKINLIAKTYVIGDILLFQNNKSFTNNLSIGVEPNNFYLTKVNNQNYLVNNTKLLNKEVYELMLLEKSKSGFVIKTLSDNRALGPSQDELEAKYKTDSIARLKNKIIPQDSNQLNENDNTKLFKDLTLDSLGLKYQLKSDTILIKYDELRLSSIFNSKYSSSNLFIKIKDFPLISKQVKESHFTLILFVFIGISILLYYIIRKRINKQ